jgi:hypothetical protein
MTQSLSEEIFSLITKDLELPDIREKFSEERALQLLTDAIGRLLDRNFERLLQICYRIDLSEKKLKLILHQSEPDHIASDLAKALWERQKQKVEIRKRYSGA